MHTMVSAIKTFFEKNANPTLAGPMAAYMRNQFPYLGIKSEQNSELQDQFYSEHGLPRLEELARIMHELWELPEREFQYIGIGLVFKFQKEIPSEFIETLESMIATKSWWDTVDTLAGNIVGNHFRRFPALRDETLSRWRGSENLWLRRTSILFQLGYKKETDFPLLCEIIHENLGSKEFFINKAIGWSLRQYSRVDEDAVRSFVAQTPLQPLSAREALKWLERRKKDSSPTMAL
ncbi:MAG: DNA alkylation repair protein [Chloroflexota bacterium]